MKSGDKISTPTAQLRSSWRKLSSLDGKLLETTTPLGSFIERYIVCEAVARKIISDHTNKPCPVKLYSTSVVSAAKHFGLLGTAGSQLISEIFRSGDGNRNCKTPRQLRNAIIHELNSQDCEEAIARHKELYKLMSEWLELFA